MCVCVCIYTLKTRDLKKYVCTGVCTWVYVHVRKCTYSRTHIHSNAHTHKHTHTCREYIVAYIYMCVCVCIYIYIYIYIKHIRLNKETFIKCLEEVVLPWIERLAAGRPCVWQQDSAPCYTSRTWCWLS